MDFIIASAQRFQQLIISIPDMHKIFYQFQKYALKVCRRTQDFWNSLYKTICFLIPYSQAEVPSFIENCVFPDASEWPPPPTDEGQACYTVILTSEAGGRKYGYCKRVLPEGATVCLPLAYCIISSVKANSFYHKVRNFIIRFLRYVSEIWYYP